MSQKELEPLRRGRLSLSVRVSVGFVLAAIIPLIITVIFSELQTRPALIDQASQAMKSDAKTRVQLINTYFNERMLDGETLAQVPSLQQFMETPPPPQTPPAVYQDAATHAAFALGAGVFRDKRYTLWTLFDAQGKLLLHFPLEVQPQPIGQYMVPPENLNAVKRGPFVSDVYYSTATHKSFVNIYVPVITPNTNIFLGFLQANLNLDYVTDIVRNDQGSNGNGSYAFILDQNGVDVVDADLQKLFTSVEPLTPDVAQSIRQEARYGNTNPVPVHSDQAITNALRIKDTQTHQFQAQPIGQNEQFQIVKLAATSVPWSYFVLSPVNTVTVVANQQLIATALIAAAVSLLVAIIGLLVGQGITRPIMGSVDSLLRSSEALSTLATKQQDAASEQMWVVDSSQVGLQSVQYYTDATAVAARQLSKIGSDLAQRWDIVDGNEAKQALGRIVNAAQYIENASQYQGVSNQKLATALKVATQVTEQLVSGTTSATDAATQLEKVVAQLRTVVGK